MKIAICDDDPTVVNQLHEFIGQYAANHMLDYTILDFTQSGQLLKAVRRDFGIRILFLDIYMEPLSGMDLAELLRAEGNECAIIFVLAIIFFSTVIKNGVVPSGSMEPTLNIGDIAVVNGLAYIQKDPQRGDIVIFKTDEIPDDTLIKRVIGLPGDSLMFIDGYLYINGELIYEEYLPEDMETNSFKDFEVPDGCYFVMGDNRTNSYDSRSWNNPYITKDDIGGKMICDIPVSKLKASVKSLIANIF